MSKLHVMTKEERMILADDLESQGDIKDEAEGFKGFTKVRVSMLRDTEGYPYLFRLKSDDDYGREV